ncbi:MAG: DUF5684 domain-containing protein [Bacteroidota bacterium]
MDEIAPLFVLAFVFSTLILYIVSFWKIFEKAGRPGWEALIPFYNVYRYIKISGNSGWMILLLFIPIVSLIGNIIINLGMAKKFGRSDGFGIGLALLGFVFIPILAFGDSVYQHEDQRDLINEIGGDEDVDEDGNHIQEIPLEDW